MGLGRTAVILLFLLFLHVLSSVSARLSQQSLVPTSWIDSTLLLASWYTTWYISPRPRAVRGLGIDRLNKHQKPFAHSPSSCLTLSIAFAYLCTRHKSCPVFWRPIAVPQATICPSSLRSESLKPMHSNSTPRHFMRTGALAYVYATPNRRSKGTSWLLSHESPFVRTPSIVHCEAGLVPGLLRLISHFCRCRCPGEG